MAAKEVSTNLLAHLGLVLLPVQLSPQRLPDTQHRHVR